VGIPSVSVIVGVDAQRRLAELGVEGDALLEAAQRGLAAAESFTSNHPSIAPGFMAWAETICALREALLPKNWERVDDGNLPLTVNASGTVAITVATGDEETGREAGNPCTKSKKGPRVASAVAANQMQLFPVPVNLANTPATGRVTWLLLIHRDYGARELRAELSRPIAMGDDDRVDGWAERILLGAVPFDDTIPFEPTPNVPQGPDIDVEIKRRA
jgi:hypothetical protein